MGNKLYEENSVQAIASAIRSKLGTETTYKIGEMADAISAIVKPSGTTNITENGYHNVTEYEQVYVHVEGGVTPTGTINLSANGDYDVTNYAEAHVAVPQPVGKKVVTENGTDIDISSYATLDVQVEQYGKPVVPQTGTWQYKSTYPCGFIIIGKDDDVADSAMFVRMVNGYGFPVTLNSTQQCQSQRCNSDSDTEYSTYPEDCGGPFFPNGCTINELNKFVIKYGLGEIAMHGVSAEKIWDSTNLTGDVLDTYYNTYTTGGGTKTKEEFKEAFIEKYADMDVAQGAPIVARKRKLLQAALDNWVYTIGTWGGSFDVVIDDINCGDSGPVNSTTQAISRSQNWMGDGQLNNQIAHYGANPYFIYRDSAGLIANKIEEDLNLAYNSRCCLDLFHHYYLDGSADKWNNFKTTLDTIDSYVRQGKIYVVTRKQFYDLGEFVEHPIVSLSFNAKQQIYGINKEFTENDFNTYVNLDNGTSIECEADRIIDLSGIDSSVEGTYTVYLEYRGFKTQCSVTVLNEIPTEYLLEDYSYSSDTPFARYANLGPISPNLQYTAGKSYRIQFHLRVETATSYSTHYIIIDPPRKTNNHVEWRQTINNYQLNTVNGITENDIIVEFTAVENAPVNSLVYIPNILNTSVTGSWAITNAYIYEIPTPEEEGGGE